jgi:hypothetical protein
MLRMAAITALAQIATDARDALPVLKALTDDKNDLIASPSRNPLGNIAGGDML